MALNKKCEFHDNLHPDLFCPGLTRLEAEALQRQLREAQEEAAGERSTKRGLEVMWREAQEERDRAHLAVESLRQSLTQLQPDYESVKAERDAAIERGIRVYRECQLFLAWGISRFAIAKELQGRAEALRAGAPPSGQEEGD